MRILPALFFLLLPALVPLRPIPASATDAVRETPVVHAVRKVSDAVVNISSSYTVPSRTSPFSGFDQNPFFDYFFRDFFDPGAKRGVERASLGSGVIIDGEKGFVLTNAHVIEQTGTIHVTLKDKREFEARIVGADAESDLAVLIILSEDPLPAVAMGNSDDLMIGETVIAIGNPFGFSHTVTTGVISALNRNIRTEQFVYRDFIQTDASINPGNSGGPLLNINGDLIGINTAVYAKAQGIGFAIPIKTAKRIVTDLIEFGKVVPAWLGLSLQEPDFQMTRYLGQAGRKGLLVKRIFPDGPADQAGIVAGDLIHAINDWPVTSREDFRARLRTIKPGDQVLIDYLRGEGRHRVTMTAAVFPESSALTLAYDLMGIRVRNGGGVVIQEITPSSHLARIGVAPGDIIRALDGMRIASIADFKKAVINSREKTTVVLLIQRGQRLYHVTVKLS